MYNINDIKDIHLEVTSKCQARCPMCPRRVQGGILNPLITLNEITISQFKKWFPIDFIAQLDSLFMCGNLGDPIVASDTLDIFKYLRKHNENIRLRMYTNGSGRSKSWWQDIAKQKVSVIFGIDGLEDTHALYRVNTDFNKIIKNAKTFIEAGGNARWDMLVFKHNEHQVEDCRKLCNELGFDEFTIKHTSRFKSNKMPVLNDAGKPTHYIEPTERSSNMIPLTQEYVNIDAPKIKCKAKNNSQIYVGSNGSVAPCCWLDFGWMLPSHDTRVDYMEQIDMFPNLNKLSLKEIFESKYFEKIENTWSNKPLLECSKQCGVFDRLGAQYES